MQYCVLPVVGHGDLFYSIIIIGMLLHDDITEVAAVCLLLQGQPSGRNYHQLQVFYCAKCLAALCARQGLMVNTPRNDPAHSLMPPVVKTKVT